MRIIKVLNVLLHLGGTPGSWHVHQLSCLGPCLMDTIDGRVIDQNDLNHHWLWKLREIGSQSYIFIQLKGLVYDKKNLTFSHKGDMVYLITRVSYVFNVWVFWGNRSLQKSIILDIYLYVTKIYHYIREVYWWIAWRRTSQNLWVSILTINKLKVEHHKQRGVTQEIFIPTWKWKILNLDFITGLRHTRKQHESNWEIVNRVIELVHFLAIKTIDSIEEYTKLHINDIDRFHRVPCLWSQAEVLSSHLICGNNYMKGVGTYVNLSTIFHPLMDG